MRWSSLALLAGLAATGSATTDDSGAVVDLVKPSAENPEGCQDSFDGKFQIEIDALSKEPEAASDTLQKRADDGADALVLELRNSVLTDSRNRTGYIASNYQFQFDGPPQAGSIYTGGFCVFNNGSLALGDSTVMYRCKSGDFYNLYDRHWAPQCDPIRVQVAPVSNADSQDQTGGRNTVGTSMMATTMVTVLPDGQPQVIQTQVPVPICQIGDGQIGDGQIQAHTTPCASAPATTSVAAPVNPVSQIADGQPQAPPDVPLAPTSEPTASPEQEPPEEDTPAPMPLAPPAKGTPMPSPSAPLAVNTPAPQASSAVEPAVEPTTSSMPRLETSTRPASTEEPEAPTSAPTSPPVLAGAEMARSGPAASLIAAVIGLFVFLY